MCDMAHNLGARADGAGRGVNIDMLAPVRRAVVARRGAAVTRVELSELRRLIIRGGVVEACSWGWRRGYRGNQ
jgi:hypothetical protein